MASARERRPENAPGDFFVDASCIDCDLCRQIAPATFGRAGGQSAVLAQPATPDAEFAALKALVACPTASIGAKGRGGAAARAAAAAFPELVDGDVYFCGFASPQSYGASSYLVVRPGGNVLVDSPRFSRPLAARIRALGGVRTMFLTHRDDVADHERWAAETGAERVMHAADVDRSTRGVERTLEGSEPIELAPDLLAIPTPGHTRGHTALLYAKYLFTGDHMWWSERVGALHASRDVCWSSWADQTRSMLRLADYEFEWVLPGHGRRAHAPAAVLREQVLRCAERMRRAA